ncbi:MAG TPA: hypothetical protein VMF08_12400 [Candidatus Sulfotelmatobacter sp.]|nr:hypothetical protein [Candidatus Sulfotelmatobacter sp.]
MNTQYHKIGNRAFSVALIALAIAATVQSTIADTTTSAPTVSIQEPVDHSSIDAGCVDVLGTFSSKNLKSIAVGSAGMGGQIPAVVNGNAFEARNIFLAPGTNVIVAVAEDLAGNIESNSIMVVGPKETPALDTMPVKVQATPMGGFAPLPVNFTVQAHVPGKILKVIYDFNGDGIPDLTNSDLRPVSYRYETSGEYSPTVTIQTDVAQFSSLSGTMMMLAAAFGSSQAAAFVNVEEPPVVMSTIPIADPVDLKWAAASNLYVLSGNPAAVTEFDAAGNIIRAVKGIGSNPCGLDVDSDGNVYVAVTGDKVVRKFKPAAASFEPDASFGNNGAIGAGQFSAPFDVMLAPDGQTIFVSDSGSGQIQTFALNGAAQPDNEKNFGKFKTPTGMAHDDLDLYWFIVDSGNGRIVLRNLPFDFIQLGTSGTNGAALGEFDDALHLSANKRGLYVADTGNNRVLLIKLPSDTPEKVWKHMIARLKADDIPAAMSDFSMASKEDYQQIYEGMSKADLLSTIKDMENIKVSTIEADRAEYYFDSVVDGKTLTFPVEFDKEFGQWKIMEY